MSTPINGPRAFEYGVNAMLDTMDAGRSPEARSNNEGRPRASN
jgi:hypothetical protein